MRKKLNKTRLILTILAAGLLLLACSATTALAGGGDSPDDAPPGDKYPDDSVYKTTFQSHTLVVKLYQQFSASDITGNTRVEKVEKSLNHSNTYLVEIDGGADPEATAAELAGQSGIAYAHPNYILNALHPVQGSIPFSDEVRIGSFEGQKAVNMTNLVAAHNDATGDQITVGVIDGGIEFSHPALEGRAVSGWDFIDEDAEAYDELGGDVSGHGTFVAGLIHLVAPDAVIRSYRIMDASGVGDGFTLAQAIERAVDDGCDVINLSVVLTNRHLAVQEAINYATANGVIVVAAAGNDADDSPVYPAAETNAIAVAAVDSLLNAADFTNFGSYIDVCAPGVGTYSAYQGDLYAWWDGTSFAAPFVAGEAALLRQNNPSLLAAQIKSKIIGSAESIDSKNPGLLGKLGAGLINPSAALGSSGETDTAAVIPDTLNFVHSYGIEYFVAPEQSALILSSNAPAAYSIQVVETTDTFVSYYTGSGQTNDSIYVSIYPGLLPIGEYINELRIDVEGVANPVYLTVSLIVIDEPPTTYQAYFTPPQMSFTALSATDPLLYGASYLASENAPASFTAEVSTGYTQFVNLHASSGTTNDSVRFDIDPGKVPGPGSYIDTIICWVDGIDNPAKLTVTLSVIDNNINPVQISPSVLIFTDVEGSTDIQTDCASLFIPFLNPPPFPSYVASGGTFSTVGNSTGTVPDSVCVEVDPAGLTEGLYTDSIEFTVDGYADPAYLAIILTIRSTDTTSGPVDTTNTPGDSTYIPNDTTTVPGDSTYIPDDSTYIPGDTTTVPGDSTTVPSGIVLTAPSDLFFYVTEGSTEMMENCAVLYHSEGMQLSYTGYVQEGSLFTNLLNLSGVTPDTICVQIDPTGLNLGSYCDSVYFYVDEYADPVLMAVHVEVNSGSDTVYSAAAGRLSQNYPNPFNPTTTIFFEMATSSYVKLDVYNVLGRKVTTLVEESLGAGEHSVQWDASNMASGIYFYRLNIGGQVETRKMVLLR